MTAIRFGAVLAAVAVTVIAGGALWRTGDAYLAGLALIFAGIGGLMLSAAMVSYYRMPLAYGDLYGQFRKNLTPPEDDAFERIAFRAVLFAAVLVLAAGVVWLTAFGLLT